MRTKSKSNNKNRKWQSNGLNLYGYTQTLAHKHIRSYSRTCEWIHQHSLCNFIVIIEKWERKDEKKKTHNNLKSSGDPCTESLDIFFICIFIFVWKKRAIRSITLFTMNCLNMFWCGSIMCFDENIVFVSLQLYHVKKKKKVRANNGRQNSLFLH